METGTSFTQPKNIEELKFSCIKLPSPQDIADTTFTSFFATSEEAIANAFSISPGARTSVELSPIITLLSLSPLLVSRTRRIFEHLAQVAALIRADADSSVVQRKDGVYMLVKGAVNLDGHHVRPPGDAQGAPDAPGETMPDEALPSPGGGGTIEVRPGGSFGRLASQATVLATFAAARATEETALLYFPADEYMQAFTVQILNETDEALQLLTTVPFLRLMERKELRLLASTMGCKSFGPNQVVFREGDVADDGLYFIHTGEAAIVKSLQYRGKTHFVEVARIGPLECFGQDALLKESLRTDSVISTQPLKVYILPAPVFHRKIVGPTLQLFHRLTKEQLSQHDVERLYAEQQRWIQYKRKLVRGILDRRRS
eukprot:gnl/Trimastix_PCT/3660.p1 GENE.gnl/Trimastix_PCT/3660~~gnl/Trimastix_PCT/3660.p1  ORF type:complete len:373 (+),score=108.18 gnl/Trimastix_PCT/3660:99-1217(+)